MCIKANFGPSLFEVNLGVQDSMIDFWTCWAHDRCPKFPKRILELMPNIKYTDPVEEFKFKKKNEAEEEEERK